LAKSDQYITLEIGQGSGGSVESHFQRATVATVLPKGTIKDI
jgi:hypothetical protein